MKIILVLFMLVLVLFSREYDTVLEVAMKDNKAYAFPSKTPYTGKGKITEKLKSICKVNVFTFKNGIADGAYETYTCSGTLLNKGTRISAVNIGKEESWNKDTGVKTTELVYDNKGNVINGWSKYFYGENLLSDMTWKDGKKTGYTMFDDSHKECVGSYSYYKDDVFIKCSAYEK